MVTVTNIKVHRRTKSSTTIQSWETYWFKVGEFVSFGIEKQDGIFKFFSKYCKTLEEAKQHIADVLNSGKSINQI